LSLASYDTLVGHRFPGAEVEIPPHFSWLWTDCVGAEPDLTRAHPSLAYLFGIRGSGLEVDDLLSLMGSRPDKGPLLGEFGFSFERPMLPGHAYRGQGQIVAVDRKQGGKVGTFDLVSFEVSLADDDGEAAMCTYTWVIPRWEE
jgi:hypothetical protein